MGWLASAPQHLMYFTLPTYNQHRSVELPARMDALCTVASVTSLIRRASVRCEMRYFHLWNVGQAVLYSTILKLRGEILRYKYVLFVLEYIFPKGKSRDNNVEINEKSGHLIIQDSFGLSLPIGSIIGFPPELFFFFSSAQYFKVQ